MDPSSPTIAVQTVGAVAKRGGNYSTQEEMAIIRVYINFTTDPITGTDQKEGTYYYCIWEGY